MNTGSMARMIAHIRRAAPLALGVLFAATLVYAGWTNPPVPPPGADGALAPASSGNIGIKTATPASALSVGGSASVGSGYANKSSPGLIVEGATAIATSTFHPFNALNLAGGVSVGGAFAKLLPPTDGLIIEGSVSVGSPLPLTPGEGVRLLIENGGVAIGNGDPSGDLLQRVAQLGYPNTRVPLKNLISRLALSSPAQNIKVNEFSVELFIDGLPLIVYTRSGFSGGWVMAAKCANTACSTLASVTEVLSVLPEAGIPSLPRLVADVSGTPIIFFEHAGVLKYARCQDLDCATTGGIQEVTGAVQPLAVSLARTTSGEPLIAYETSGSQIYVLRCIGSGDTVCSQVGGVNYVAQGRSPSLGLSPKGLPVLAYANGGLKFVRCETENCSSVSPSVPLDIGSGIGLNPSLTIGLDGMPVIAYEGAGGTLKVAHCDRSDCQTSPGVPSADIHTVDAVESPDAARTPSITIGPTGFPLIAYSHTTFGGVLKVIACNDASCNPKFEDTSALPEFSIVPYLADDAPAGAVGATPQLLIGADGLPFIVYGDSAAKPKSVRSLSCGSERCIPYWTRR